MKKLVISIAIPLLAACSSVPDGTGSSGVFDVTSRLHPYRIDVRQGNMVTQEMVAQLKPGLTKDQVRFILGTPLLPDVFHADRWDYVYRLRKGDGELQQRRIVVFFTDGKLARVGGDVATDAAAPKPTARVIDIKAPADTATPGEKAAPVAK